MRNPKLEYIPDNVGEVGDEFTREGVTYRIVEDPSSDGEVALCLRLDGDDAEQANDYQSRVAEAAMFVTDDDVERACLLFYGNWELATDKDATRFAMRKVLEVFVFKRRFTELMARIQASPELLECLIELYAVVRGECPRLLDEDSGGNSELEMNIIDAISKAKGEL